MGIIKSFLANESLVSDIPAGDGKIDNLFYSVYDVGTVPRFAPTLRLKRTRWRTYLRGFLPGTLQFWPASLINNFFLSKHCC
jgi:hypothetical protein